jgi:hypothetical protein
MARLRVQKGPASCAFIAGKFGALIADLVFCFSAHGWLARG